MVDGMVDPPGGRAFPNVTRIAERSADWEVAKSGLVAQPSPEDVKWRRVPAGKRGWAAAIFTLPCQAEGRGPEGDLEMPGVSMHAFSNAGVQYRRWLG